MAKSFSKSFYNSRPWKDAREAYVKSRLLIDAGDCELCQEKAGEEVHHKIFLTPTNIDDPKITLNPDNFELLCYDCHRLRHETARKIAYLASIRRRGIGKILKGGKYYLDENGNVNPFRCIVVWGSPGSGKSTYVQSNMSPGDAVIDLDLIGHALSMAQKSETPPNILPTAFDVRDFLLEKVERREINARTVWIVATLPRKTQRADIKSRLDAELVYIRSTIQECYRHMLHDDERKDKALQASFIDKWWKDYEPD